MRTRKLDPELFPVTELDGPEAFQRLGNLPHGYVTFDYNGLPIDLLNRPEEGAETTIVILHAAVPKDIDTLPYFLGKTVTKDAPANRLWIQDPSLYMDERLSLAWYAGNGRQPDLQRLLTDVIRKACELHGSSRLVFFGASGGGFASLYFSRMFPGSLAIAVNPQTIIRNYIPKMIENYEKYTEFEALRSGEAVTDLREHYQGHENYVAYVQNKSDESHIEGHMLPFLEAVEGSERVRVKLGNWGEGHVPPGKTELNDMIVHTVASSGKWWDALDHLRFEDAPTVRKL